MHIPIDLGTRVTDGTPDTFGTPPRVTLTPADSITHLYVTGLSRSGKSRLVESIARQRILAWRAVRAGMLVIDPHGSMVDGLVSWMARYDLSDRPVIVVDLGRQDWVVGLSPLVAQHGEDAHDTASRFADALGYAWGEGDTKVQPLYEQWATNIAYTLIQNGLTPVEAEMLFEAGVTDLKRMLVRSLQNPTVAGDWAEAFRLSSSEYRAQIGSTLRRWSPLLKSRTLRLSLGQSRNLDWRRALDEGWIVLVSLAKSGSAGHALATLVLADLWHAAGDRGKRDDVVPFYVLLDEFQHFITPTIAQNLAEAAGFKLSLTLAHQFPNQLRDGTAHGERLFREVLANAQSKVVFTLGDEDARLIASHVGAPAGVIRALPKRHCLVRSPSGGTAISMARTPDVFEAMPSASSRHDWLNDQMSAWMNPGNGAFVYRGDKAAANIAARHAALRAAASAVTSDKEPTTTKRRVPKRPAPRSVQTVRTLWPRDSFPSAAGDSAYCLLPPTHGLRSIVAVSSLV